MSLDRVVNQLAVIEDTNRIIQQHIEYKMKRKKVGPAKASTQTRVKKARIGEDVGNQPSTSESSSNSVVISMHHSDTDEDQQDSNNQRSILTLNRSRTDTVPITPEERMRNQIPPQHYESSSSDSKGHVPEISHSAKITAMASLDESLKDPEFANWVKSCMALIITNEVLRPFVVKEITKFQSIVKTLSQKSIRKEIKKIHWYPYPSFENTSQRSWRTEPWEIAKCFMPPYQVYKRSTASDADFSACISVIINCKRFQAFGTSDPREKEKKNDHSKSRDFRNEVMHSISQKVPETYMKENLDTLISIINNLQTAETKMAIEKIQKNKTNQLKIKLEDVIEAKKNAIEANVDNSKKDKDQVQRERLLVNFEAGCRKALCRLTEDLISKQKGNDNKTKSVEAFLSNLSMFAERKNLCSLHQEMLFPETGTPTDIGQWDMFVYCFILEDIDLYESPENAVSNFVKAVKEIRDKLLLYATEVTQDDLSKLYEYKIDTDLKTEITEIFNKDASHFTNADVIRSYNTLKSWWRDEEEYGKKPAPRQQLNHKRQLIQEVKSTYETVGNMFQSLLATLGYRGGRESLYRDVEPRLKCNVEACGCDKKTKKAIEEDFTSSNNEDLKTCIDDFRRQLYLLEVNPEIGCIILNVKCSSITNMLDFWDSCIDGRAVKALSEVRDYYRRYCKCDTLVFDVILTRKGVSSCVNEIVEGLQPHVQEMIDKATDKVHEILEAKENLSSNLSKSIDIRTEEERTKEEKQIKDNEPIPGSVNEPIPGSDNEPIPGSDNESIPGSDNEPIPGLDNEPIPWSDNEPIPGSDNEPIPQSDNPASNLSKSIDISTEEERTKEEKQIKDNEPKPGSDNEPIPWSDNEPIPASDNGPIPGSDNEPIPGLDNEPIPGSDNEPMPGSDNEPIPGSDNEPIPGSENEPIPRSDNEPIPGSDNEPIPGSDYESIHGSDDEPSADDEGSDILSNLSEKTQLKEIDFRAEGVIIMKWKPIKAMASIDIYLKDPEYKNWVKSGLALNITNEVLRPFVVKEITKLHQSIVKTLPRGVSCTGCSVNTACPYGICDEIQREIENKHWYYKPSFTNTHTGRWSAEPWEIAKCYMSPSKRCKRSSASDADFSACISVIINCKHFQAFGTSDPKITETVYFKSRDFWNRLMYASPQKVTENDMRENLDMLINILNMIKTPETEDDTKEAIEKIEKIKADHLTIKLEDVIEVQKTTTEAVADKREKNKDQVQRERLLVNFETGCRKALCRFTEEHISKQEENLTVADFLSRIRFLAVVKNLCQRHQEMLFPKYGSHADIREWDLFAYCFILEELDLHEAIGNAVFLFIQEVKKIRDKILLDGTGVTQNDLSELCKYLIDTDLNIEITEIFNKDSPDVDVIRSYNILVSWWRDEEDYGKKQVSNEQLNNNIRIMKVEYKRVTESVDNMYQRLMKRLGYEGEQVLFQVPFQEAHAAVKIGAEAEVRPRGCNEKMKKALQEYITNSNNDDTEKTKSLNNLVIS